MRLHIELDDEVVREVDRLTGPRERTAFVRAAVIRAIDDAKRSAALQRAAGSLRDAEAHEWDLDPAAWVKAARHADSRRAG